MQPVRARAWVVVLAWLVAGCSVTSQARQTFATAHACPEDRLTAFDRGKEPPPSDIAGDPERVRMWSSGTTWELVEVRGCGARQLYRCRHGTGDPSDTGSGQWTCQTTDEAVKPSP